MSSSMSVPVMNVGIVRMAVTHGLVGVPMRMRFTGRCRRVVGVAMVLVVLMAMLMFDCLVRVFVIVTFADV